MTDDVVARFSRLATSTIGNALDELGCNGIVHGLHPLVGGRLLRLTLEPSPRQHVWNPLGGGGVRRPYWAGFLWGGLG